ncbi:MAG: hypothetical protein KDD55_12545 [Bdellovibrionales bacterium]|nr:hypothetical protein [Bdellovibrionales bacterium]
MTTSAAERIIEGLTLFMDGFIELRERIEGEFGGDDEDDFGNPRSSSEVSLEIDAALVTEIRASLEAVIDAEDLSTEELATAISTVTDAIEEIDPDVFASEEEEEEDELEDEEYEDDGEYDEESLEDLEEDEFEDYEDEEEEEGY